MFFSKSKNNQNIVSTSGNPQIKKSTSQFSNISKSLKQNLGNLNELNHTSAVKINTNYKLDSNDDTEYSMATEVINGKVKCMIYISCENAKLLKSSLQTQITLYNSEHKDKEEKLKSIKDNISSINLTELNFMDKTIDKILKSLEEKRNIDRVKPFEPNPEIPVFVSIKGYGGTHPANIVKIYPKVAKFDIKYKDIDGKIKSVVGIDFNQLCVISDQFGNSGDCDLTNIQTGDIEGVALENTGDINPSFSNEVAGGAKKPKKSKKKNMNGGGNEDSISTNSLC